MKRAIKYIIPNLLVLTIIVCTCWYLFEYDREFTRDLLLYSARYMEKQGSHSTAQVFYNLAYNQANDNDQVAIELAEQYVEHGNYTKAEYTLYKAIQDGGSVDLYVALSKTYVQQDKLLDAANLLNNITGEAKTALEAMRPSAPKVSPDPDFYTQYISVTVTSESGKLYANTSGRYPSVATDAYTEPFVLTEGENTICAMAVNDAGLVSPLAIYGYTVGGVVEQITFSDSAVEQQLRQTLNLAENTVLYSNDLWSITEFTVPAEATDYSDLKYLPFLEKLTITDGVSGYLSNLSGMSNLTHLEIRNTSVSTEELSVIGSLAKLESLTLNNCSLSTVSPLSNLSALTYLDLSNNTIRDIDALSSMDKLQELHLQRNAITDPAALTGCPMLSKLDLSFNSITSVNSILTLSELSWLDISNNSITAVANINKLANLQHLYIGHNQLTDIGPIASCTKLVDLSIEGNQLTSISDLSNLSSLMFLNFSHNQITELPAFAKNCKLVTIDGSHNNLSSIDQLAGLESLNNVYMDYNTELKSIEKLSSCHVLIRVNVYGTKVTDVDSLTEQSIIVNYDPTQ